MHIFESLDSGSRDRIEDLLGNTIPWTLTTIRTLYTNDREEHSGTGLMTSDSSLKYVLTADHVLSPKHRVPPRKLPTKRHYHSFGLRLKSGPVKAFALRTKFYRSKSLDLALVESSLSGRPEFDSREGYYPLEQLKNAVEFDVYADDLFVLCGFPHAWTTTITVPYETRHRMLIHLLSGVHGGEDPTSGSFYRIRYDGDQLDPTGLSGSPVWLIREYDNPNKPLSFDHLMEKPEKRLSMFARFCGIACKYFAEERQIAVVKPAICSAFVKKAASIMPSLRLSEEDDWISEQLAYLSQR